MSVKILSDFDGVWTDQAPEAAHVTRHFVAEAARVAEVGEREAREHFAGFTRIVTATPERYGWAPDGRITAYVDEDPLCETSALAMYLDGAHDDEPAKSYASAIRRAGFENATSFANACFFGATRSFRSLHPSALVPHAKEQLQALVAAGAEVVIVSNSPAEKIVGWFREAGVEASDGAGGALRVRGSAEKFGLGASDASIEVGGRRIYVDRPRYAEALRDERADIVIGDVFSLDLALPHVLRGAGDLAAPRALVLRRHAHTPRWVADTRADGAIDRIVEHVGDLVESVRGRARARR